MERAWRVYRNRDGKDRTKVWRTAAAAQEQDLEGPGKVLPPVDQMQCAHSREMGQWWRCAKVRGKGTISDGQS